MKFLSIISSLNIILGSIPFLSNRYNDNRGSINLYAISLKEINININKIEKSYNNLNKNNLNNYDKKLLFTNILDKEVRLNRINEKLDNNLKTIYDSYINKSSDWKVQLPNELPKAHNFLEFNISAIYHNSDTLKASDIQDGQLNLYVKFVNNSVEEQKDIWDIFENRNLKVKENEFLYKNEQDVIWNKIYDANIENIKKNSLTRKDFIFIKITYTETVIQIKDNNSKFFGVCIFNYKADVDFSSLSLKVKPLSVISNQNHLFDYLSYASSIVYTPILGKEALCDSYNIINYNFNVDLSCTGLPVKNFNFNSDYYESDSLTYSYKFFPINTYGGYIPFCSLYLHTNYTHIIDEVELHNYWVGNKLIITIKINVSTFSEYGSTSGGIAKVSDLILHNFKASNDLE